MYPSSADPRSDIGPFHQLLASRPARQRRGSVTAAIAALTFHAIALAGLVWATRATAKVVPGTDDSIPVLPVNPPPEPLTTPVPPPPTTTVPTAPASVPRTTAVLPAPPVLMPTTIPPITAGPITDERSYSGEGVAPGTAVGSTARPGSDPDVSVAPVFVPRTVDPQLRDPAAAARTLERAYPPLLRDAGVGGRTLLWLLVDETGAVVDARVQETSGHEAMDSAAVRAARGFRFTPAYNRDQKVKVWISLPIDFRVR